MGLSAYVAAGDVWLRLAINPVGAQYNEYILVFVDDIMAILLDPQCIIDTLSNVIL
jgi:hypothetical protein